MSKPDERTIVIVGGVAGGATAATRARRCNEKARIIIYEKDGYASFANCGLPYYIGGEITDRAKLLVAKAETFRDRYKIELNTRHLVTGVDAEARVVHVQNQDTGATFTQSYDRLILAPGAAPIVPPIPGATASNVFTLRNMEDTDRIYNYLETAKPQRAAVIGAGFIGLEMAEQLQHRGIEIAVIELADQVLPPLDPEMAAFIAEELRAKGVELVTADGVKTFETEADKVTGVTLNSGKNIAVDMVILSIGVRPMTELAKGAGLDIEDNGGIHVNAHMQTSRPEIYAVGDAVAYTNGITGQTGRVPLAGPANRAARVAGEHAATDAGHPMAPVLGTAIIRVFAKTAALTGLTMKAAARAGIAAKEAIITANNHAGYYPGAQSLTLKLVYCPTTGRVLGAQAVGGDGVDKRIDVIATAISFGATVYQLGGLDLCYAPPFGSAKDPVHVAAFVAMNDLDKRSPLVNATTKPGDTQFVDVRNPDEIARCCRPGAIQIPLDQLRDRIGELDPNRETLVTCQSGLRAHLATCLLKQSGFDSVSNLTGGMLMQQRVCPGELVSENK
jgi:NADPH-dependent 2,4-dienoyl-CoA reductase/sulfur reductase-like enzyme/rhodanese-related sulfurtransferase